MRQIQLRELDNFQLLISTMKSGKVVFIPVHSDALVIRTIRLDYFP